MDKSHIHTHILHRTLLFLRLSSRIHTFLFPAIFPLSSKNNLLFPASPARSPPPTLQSSSFCFLSLNLHGHAHRRPASCRLSIIPLSQKGIGKRDITLFVVPPVRKSIRDGARATAHDGCRPQKTN